MNIQEMTTEAIKALAYDQFIIIETAQNNLKLLNQELNRRNQPINPEPNATTQGKEEHGKELEGTDGGQ